MSTDLITQNLIQDPKSSLSIVDLPFGYVDKEGNLITEVEVLEIDGEIEDLLLSRSTDAAKKINGMLAGCLKRVGKNTKKSDFLDIVKQLTVGDRTFLLFTIRKVTFGDEYVVNEICPKCSKDLTFTINLSDLEIKKPQDPKARIFDGELKDGTKIKFQVPTGVKEEIAFKNSSNSESDMTTFLFMRLHSIDDSKVTWDMLKKLNIKKRTALRSFLLNDENFKKTDGFGVETTMEYTCEFCEHEFKKELNTDFNFFFPALMQES